MEKINFEVYATDATIKPDNYNRIRVEVGGVEISDLLESIGDNDSVIEEIGGKEIAEYFSAEERLLGFLENIDSSDIAKFLEEHSWAVQEVE